MAQENIRYPINTQTFSKIRENNFVYVDKTEYVYNMTHSDMSGGKHMSEEKLDEYLKYLLDRNERSFDLPLTPSPTG